MALLDINWYAFTIPVAVILLGVAIFLICKLRYNRALAEKLCYWFLMFLLVYKGFHYILYCTVFSHDISEQIPCEISQISFFLCPIAFLSQNKWIKDAGRFLGFFAGCMQLIAIAVAPMNFVNSGSLYFFSFVETIVMHYILFWCGLVQMLCIEKMEIKNLWKVYSGVLLVVLWGVLASFTWRYGTDAGYPDAPANIAFVQRCVLPQAIIDFWPWLGVGHNFISVYLVLFFGFTGIVYALSYCFFKKNPKQDPSMYGMGWSQMRKFLNTHDVAIREKDCNAEIKQ